MPEDPMTHPLPGDKESRDERESPELTFRLTAGGSDSKSSSLAAGSRTVEGCILYEYTGLRGPC